MPGIRPEDLIGTNQWHSSTVGRQPDYDRYVSPCFHVGWKLSEVNPEAAVLRSIRNQANTLFSYSEFPSLYAKFNSSIMFGHSTDFLYNPTSMDEIVDVFENNKNIMVEKYNSTYGMLSEADMFLKLLTYWRYFSKAHTSRSIRRGGVSYNSQAIMYYYKHQGGYESLNAFFTLQLNWLMTHTKLEFVISRIASNTGYQSVVLMPLIAKLATRIKQSELLNEVPEIEFSLYPRAGILCP